MSRTIGVVVALLLLAITICLITGCTMSAAKPGTRIADARNTPGYPGRLDMEAPAYVKDEHGNIVQDEEGNPVTTDQAVKITPARRNKMNEAGKRHKAEHDVIMAKERANGLIEAGPKELRDCDSNSLLSIPTGITGKTVAITSPVPFRVVRWAMMPLPADPGNKVPPKVGVIVYIDGRPHAYTVGPSWQGEIRGKGTTIVVTSPTGKCVNICEMRMYK